MSELITFGPLTQALLASLTAWAMTALGAALVLFARRAHPLLLDALLALGAGVMLASSYFSLLAPAIEHAARAGQLPFLVAALGFLCGGAVLLAAEAVMARRAPAYLAGAQSRRRCTLLVASITLHNIPEGLAIGVAFGALAADASPAACTAAWLLALGIAAQNFPEGAAVSLPLRREGLTRRRAFLLGQFSGAVEPLSALLGCLLATQVQCVLPFALAFAAGAMVTVVVAELTPEMHASRRPALMTLALLAGFALMMTLDVSLS